MYRAGFVCVQKRCLVHLFRQLHRTNAFVVALHSCRFFAFALSRWFFVKLTCTQISQQAQFFNLALKATQSYVKRFILF